MKKIFSSLALFYFIAASALNAQSASVYRQISPITINQAKGTMKYHNQHVTNIPQTILYDSIYYWTLDTIAKAWDVTGKEVNIVYNAGNKITSDLVQSRNGSAWVDSLKDTYQYNANNYDTTDIEQSWTGKAWENEYHYSYTYNASDSETSATEQIWSGSAWRNYMKFIYTYDAHNNKTSDEGEQWNGNAWTVGWIYSFTFNANNLKTKEVDSTNVGSEQFVFNYNAHNLLISDTSQYWDNVAWAEDFNYGYSYNANNLDTSEVTQQLINNKWTNYERFAYNYDANNNTIGELDQIWSVNEWVRFLQYAYTYNANNIMQSAEYRQYYNGGKVVLLGDSTYWYFHKSSSGVQQLSEVNGQWSVYPNPGKGIFFIQPSVSSSRSGGVNGAGTSISVYNMLGEKVFSQLPNVPVQTGIGGYYPLRIDLSSLSNGVYLISLQSEQGMMNGKIVIQR